MLLVVCAKQRSCRTKEGSRGMLLENEWPDFVVSANFFAGREAWLYALVDWGWEVEARLTKNDF